MNFLTPSSVLAFGWLQSSLSCHTSSVLSLLATLCNSYRIKRYLQLNPLTSSDLCWKIPTRVTSYLLSPLVSHIASRFYIIPYVRSWIQGNLRVQCHSRLCLSHATRSRNVIHWRIRCVIFLLYLMFNNAHVYFFPNETCFHQVLYFIFVLSRLCSHASTIKRYEIQIRLLILDPVILENLYI